MYDMESWGKPPKGNPNPQIIAFSWKTSPDKT